MNAIGWLGAWDALQPNEKLEKLKYLETVISEKRGTNERAQGTLNWGSFRLP